MRYWWVNQNQTYRHEVKGGYLWSPKRNANGARNPFYESMREVAPGDLVFSFVDTRIGAIGVAQSYCWESPKPSEFGAAGQNWEDIGWRVRVAFTRLDNQIRPKDHIDILRSLLPERYSPLQPNGNGLQSVYLTELP
jgi:putative restriction endonuclease